MSLFWKREAGNAPATWAEGGPGGGGVSEITSDDASVAITNPTGPTVDLSVSGGGLPFTGWTEDDSDPANVDANGGELRSTDGDGNHAQLFGTSVSVGDVDGVEGYSMELGSGITSTPPPDVPAFSATDTFGATVAFDGGGLPAKNLAEGTDPSDAATVSQLGGVVPFVGDDPPGSPTDGMLWWDPDDDTPVGGSSPGVGDYIIVELDTPVSVSNNGDTGAAARIAWDSLDEQHGETITLSEDTKTINVSLAGIYSVSVVLDFDTADETGRRAVMVSDSKSGGTWLNGAPGTKDKQGGSESNVAIGYVTPLGVNGTVEVIPLVNGAAGAVDLEFAYAIVTRLV